MNRLVIIGNGFDLAHGLPTSYGSFLNWIWKNFNAEIPLIDNLFNLDRNDFIVDIPIESYKDFKDYVFKRFQRGAYHINIRKNNSFEVLYRQLSYDNTRVVFSFKNRLFQLITQLSLENWVDLENIYYNCLISLSKSDNKFPQFDSVEVLNEDFQQIKILLDYYLNNEVEDAYDFDESQDRCRSVIDLFEYEFKNLSKLPNHSFFNEFPSNYRDELTTFDDLFNPMYEQPSVSPYKNLFLDFNYTGNAVNYFNILCRLNRRYFGKMNYIQIHGKINSKRNPINFGFGDEMDDHYKILENTGNNDFLKNIKSFMYFNNSDYRNLLNWIESEDYQIYIMGHSCGLSDRTLLNTVFEHRNCKSIKVFYHKKDEYNDNFTDLTQNISRHFNKKSMMREKVVDKSLSIPLPQNIRYEKKSPK